MHVCAQWALADPSDWDRLDAEAWASAPNLPEPTGGEALGPPGWVHALCIQGDVWEGYDHYAVEDLGGGLVRVTAWCDDPDDVGEDECWGRAHVYRPHRPDAQMGGAINKQTSCALYSGSALIADLRAKYRGTSTIVRPWSSFPFPPSSAVRHGIWTDDDLHGRHRSARSLRGWREWTDGLDPKDIDGDGLVKVQRALGRYVVAKGTRTYYHANVTRTVAAYACPFENALDPSVSGGPFLQTDSNVGTGGKDAWGTVTPANEPDSAAWPTGEYRHQIDVPSVGVDVNYGALPLGNNSGGFHRVNASANLVLESHPQDQAVFSGAGLKLAIYDGPWTAGVQGDRFAVIINNELVSGMGSQTMSIQINELDDNADGPWTAAGQNIALQSASMTAAAHGLTIKDPEIAQVEIDLLSTRTVKQSLSCSRVVEITLPVSRTVRVPEEG